MPALARENTTAGAKAFIRYYVDVLNYAWLQPAPRVLATLSDERCLVCQKLVATISRYYRAGGYQRGGQWTVQRIYALPGRPNDHPGFLLSVKIADGSWKKSHDDTVHKIVATEATNEVDLSFADGAWAVSDVTA